MRLSLPCIGVESLQEQFEVKIEAICIHEFVISLVEVIANIVEPIQKCTLSGVVTHGLEHAIQETEIVIQEVSFLFL